LFELDYMRMEKASQTSYVKHIRFFWEWVMAEKAEQQWWTKETMVGYLVGVAKSGRTSSTGGLVVAATNMLRRAVSL